MVAEIWYESTLKFQQLLQVAVHLGTLFHVRVTVAGCSRASYLNKETKRSLVKLCHCLVSPHQVDHVDHQQQKQHAGKLVTQCQPVKDHPVVGHNPGA